MASLRDAILEVKDLPQEKVRTDEWAPSVPFVHIRGLSAAERDQWEQGLTATINGRIVPKTKIKNLRAQFVVKILVDENGDRIFKDSEVDLLGNKSAAVLDRLWDVGRRLSGMQTEEELEEENPSTGDQEDTNSSDSPSPSESLTPIGSLSDSQEDS